jgi:hypothetical protein
MLPRRRDLLVAGLGVGAPWSLAAEFLRPRLVGDRLFVGAPQLRFLMGRPLERLHNGSSVWFDFSLSALAERPAAGVAPRVLERAVERFAVSYDLWEEKYSVSRLSPPALSASHLTSALVESWCLDHFPLATASLAPDRPFWLRLEVRAEDPRDRPAFLDETGVNLSRLIELFSRPSRAGQTSWLVDDGPFRLADLKSRGRGNGAG